MPKVSEPEPSQRSGPHALAEPACARPVVPPEDVNASSVDVNVLVLAVAVGESPFRSWPSPPTSGNPIADCLGVVNDAAQFALWLSPHILASTGRVLATVLKTR
jgi:hypothetical protein